VDFPCGICGRGVFTGPLERRSGTGVGRGLASSEAAGDWKRRTLMFGENGEKAWPSDGVVALGYGWKRVDRRSVDGWVGVWRVPYPA
jgi:hypothetical protein